MLEESDDDEAQKLQDFRVKLVKKNLMEKMAKYGGDPSNFNFLLNDVSQNCLTKE